MYQSATSRLIGQFFNHIGMFVKCWKVNKVAIVTGASSGIGYATSLALSKAGVRVAVGARRIDRLQELEKQIIKNIVRKRRRYLYPKKT